MENDLRCLLFYIKIQLKWHYISNIFLYSALPTFYIQIKKTGSKNSSEFAFILEKSTIF